ncbi:MAG: hypothetical protein JNM95_13560 [Chitinophagaceae bacterium]|nr:hypothetical protein [Chitinophagaceae bacterium]
MRHLIFLFLSLFCLNLNAQIKAKAPKQKQAGLFLETQLDNSGSNGKRGLGLMFKKEARKNHHIRLQAGYVTGSRIHSPYSYTLKGDTLIEKSLVRNDEGVFVGLGAEIERPFYKKVSLYASCDARLRYEWSSYENHQNSKVGSGTAYNYVESFQNKIPNYKANTYSLDIMPSIGAKLSLRRIELALESGFTMQHAYFKESLDKTSSIFDFDINAMRTRFLLLYQL